MDLFALVQNQIGFFLLIFARITGIFTTAPVFGARNIPVYLKAGLALILSYTILPIISQEIPNVSYELLPFAILAISEFLLGLILGFVSFLIFSAVQMAGHLLDMQIGFGIVNVFDPQFGQQIPLIGNFKYLLALVTFLATNGHHLFITALFDSFRLVPVTQVVFNTNIAIMFTDFVIGAFVIGFKLTLPVLVTLLLMDIVLGILSRTMPQLNIFVVGLPGKLIAGTFMLLVVMPFYILFLDVAFNDMFKNIYLLIHVFRGS